MQGILKLPLLNLIDEKIYKTEFNLFGDGLIGGTKKGGPQVDKKIRSVKLRPFDEEHIGVSVSNRVIFNELKMATSQIEHIYREKISRFYFSSDNYFEFLYYNEKMDGHYSYHTDYMKTCPRALTILIGINSKDEYTGGELFVQNLEKPIILDKGDIVCFPSNFMYPHKVEKVTKGERKVVVIWTQ